MSSRSPSPTNKLITSINPILSYHLQTKHSFQYYARSSKFLDWKNQPNPFRRYNGCEFLSLRFIDEIQHQNQNQWRYPSPKYYDIYQRGNTTMNIPVNHQTISRFLELSLGITAWKQSGRSTWALRSNPSSGNLHPTEGFILLPSSSEFQSGLYHYCPKDHGLELRAKYDPETFQSIIADYPTSSFFVGLTSIHWREAWKYGERAYRYCNHDIGHAIASIRIAAATLGWNAILLDGLKQNELAALLGTSRSHEYPPDEIDHPESLLLVWPNSPSDELPSSPPSSSSSPSNANSHQCHPISIPNAPSSEKLSQLFFRTSWSGDASRLSKSHDEIWDVIDHVASHTWKSIDTKKILNYSSLGNETDFTSQVDRTHDPLAVEIIRQRRSAQDFNPDTSIISFESFLQLLSRIFPKTIEIPQLQDNSFKNSSSDDIQSTSYQSSNPWDVWPYEPTIHLVLFVHRVSGLDPGIYFLFRHDDPEIIRDIKQSTDPTFIWELVPNGDTEHSLPLYLLKKGDVRRVAKILSCNQEIASDGAFSLGMIAEFDEKLNQNGNWWYPRMFWESGIIGHLLYLESEVIGMRSTGIGCFFDDPVHELLGMEEGTKYQSIYHFTIGDPIIDTRISTLPPYHHLVATNTQHSDATKTQESSSSKQECQLS